MPTPKTILIGATVSLLGACASLSGPVTVADTIGRDPQLSTLNGLVRQAGLAEMLKGSGPYTVFAPTNDAFKAVPAKTMEELRDALAKARHLCMSAATRFVPSSICPFRSQPSNPGQVAA